jgi:hypothetical protein
MRKLLKRGGIGFVVLIVLGAIFGNSGEKAANRASTEPAIERSNDPLPRTTMAGRARARAATDRRVAQAKARVRANARATLRERARARARAAARRHREAARRVAQEQARAAAPPASNCDPNYKGACLDPNASDYDCEGGSGDGPKYTGTVTVVGSDHYDLDRDGDGTGCDA